MVVQTRVKKWGNSLGIRLKKDVADKLKLQDGSDVDLNVSGDRIVITRSAPEYSLKDLIDKVDQGNIHRETKTGSPVGDEIW